MSKLGNILTGWGKALKLLPVSAEERQMSLARMDACTGCPAAKSSSILKLLHGQAHNLSAIYCGECKCPVNEKSLVKTETCPLGKWENI